MKTYFYAVQAEELPEGFRAEINRLDLAKRGIWETNAPNVEQAEEQIIRFVKMMTNEVIEPGVLQVKRTTALLKEIEAVAPILVETVVETAPEIVPEPVPVTVPEPVLEIAPEPVPVIVEMIEPPPVTRQSRRWIDWLLGQMHDITKLRSLAAQPTSNS